VIRRFLPERLYRWLYEKAWPFYKCAQCVGQEWWQPCYCAYYGCSGPCEEPSRWQRILRAVLRR
jgi:hypothetical protein